VLSSDYFCTQNGKPATVLLRECNVLYSIISVRNEIVQTM